MGGEDEEVEIIYYYYHFHSMFITQARYYSMSLLLLFLARDRSRNVRHSRCKPKQFRCLISIVRCNVEKFEMSTSPK